MKKIILSVLITFALLILIFLIIIYSGTYNVSQLEPHTGLTKWVVETTMEQSIEKRSMEITIPENLNDSSVINTGFNYFKNMCAGCHGAPGKDAMELVKGLYPQPPKLHEQRHEDELAEFFWVIKNGIKMTAMPAFGPTHSDEDIWAMAYFVNRVLPELSPAAYEERMNKNQSEHQH